MLTHQTETNGTTSHANASMNDDDKKHTTLEIVPKKKINQLYYSLVCIAKVTVMCKRILGDNKIDVARDQHQFHFHDIFIRTPTPHTLTVIFDRHSSTVIYFFPHSPLHR
jgi:hypothetical protein